MSFSQSRLDALKAAIVKLGADAFYVRDTRSIEWLTGFEDVFDEEQAHAMLVPESGNAAYLHSDSRYITALRREAKGSSIVVDAEVIAMSDWACRKFQEVFAERSSRGTLAIEDCMVLKEYRKLRKAFSRAGIAKDEDAGFVETEDAILELRAVKDASEIKLLKEAQALTDAAFDHICAFIRPGLTEREIQLELDDFMMRGGADALAFPSIVASGSNGASPHAIVSDKPVQKGECIVMDFGARRRGYCSDMTRTVFLGEPEGEMRKAWNTLRRANEAVQEVLAPGMTGKQAHELAEKVLAEGGFEGRMGHGLGHGVGIQVHELPNLNTRNDSPLVSGNVVTVEPGIYIPGKFGMRLEDFGVISESGFERFTQSTHEMVVL